MNSIRSAQAQIAEAVHDRNGLLGCLRLDEYDGPPVPPARSLSADREFARRPRAFHSGRERPRLDQIWRLPHSLRDGLRTGFRVQSVGEPTNFDAGGFQSRLVPEVRGPGSERTPRAASRRLIV